MKSWKKLEQKVARMRETERTPLSGGNSRQTRSDTLDNTFFIECKLRKDPAVWNLYEQVEELAKKENKIPVLVIKKKGKHGDFVFFLCEFFNLFVQVPYCRVFAELTLYKECFVQGIASGLSGVSTTQRRALCSS